MLFCRSLAYEVIVDCKYSKHSLVYCCKPARELLREEVEHYLDIVVCMTVLVGLGKELMFTVQPLTINNVLVLVASFL